MQVGETVMYLGGEYTIIAIADGVVHIADGNGNGYAILETIFEEVTT
jgi:hypothetical protein